MASSENNDQEMRDAASGAEANGEEFVYEKQRLRLVCEKRASLTTS